MARQLEAIGRRVAFLGLIDTYGPGYPCPLPLLPRLRSHLHRATHPDGQQRRGNTTEPAAAGRRADQGTGREAADLPLVQPPQRPRIHSRRLSLPTVALGPLCADHCLHRAVDAVPGRRRPASGRYRLQRPVAWAGAGWPSAVWTSGRSPATTWTLLDPTRTSQPWPAPSEPAWLASLDIETRWGTAASRRITASPNQSSCRTSAAGCGWRSQKLIAKIKRRCERAGVDSRRRATTFSRRSSRPTLTTRQPLKQSALLQIWRDADVRRYKPRSKAAANSITRHSKSCWPTPTGSVPAR